MVLVPAGEFTMGTDRSDGGGLNVPRMHSDANPQHAVTLPAFFIDKTEVTNAAYKKFCDAMGYAPPPHWKDGRFPAGEDDFAVTHVNWWEAKAYATWAGKRLPTEAEWEKTARSTDARYYPWGQEWKRELAVWDQTRAQRVGTKPEGASPYGVLDLAGNVFEWTASWYRAYPKAPQQFAEYGEVYKVMRGGAFFGFEVVARTYYRSLGRPQTRSALVGFRCAKDAKGR
ncbi:MAG: hypothetical protein JWN98_125 [Abditibacteriota bacterium]|nr:hypothetical protein [Abditibacteriota bacterium]